MQKNALTTGTRDPALLVLMRESKRLHEFRKIVKKSLRTLPKDYSRKFLNSRHKILSKKIEPNRRTSAAIRLGYELTPASSMAIVRKFARGQG